MSAPLQVIDEPELQMTAVTVRFGGVLAVDDVTFGVRRGEIFGIVGANGAGKSTVLNVVSGLITPSQGQVFLGTTDLTKVGAWKRQPMGIGRSFQLVGAYGTFTAGDYVGLGGLSSRTTSLARVTFGGAGVRRSESECRTQVLTELERYDLLGTIDRQMRELPYGIRKVLDLIRATIAGPRLVLMDEPTSGCGVSDRRMVVEVVEACVANGATVVLIDHNMEFIRRTCGRVLVLEKGAVIASGTADQVFRRQEVMDSFLGVAPVGAD